MQTFAQYVGEARLAARLSMHELARRAHTTAATVSRISAGKSHGDFDTVEKLARVLNLPEAARAAAYFEMLAAHGGVSVEEAVAASARSFEAFHESGAKNVVVNATGERVSSHETVEEALAAAGEHDTVISETNPNA